MRAVVVHGAKDIRVEDHAEVAPGPDEVQIRIAYGGLCGSDLHYYHRGRVANFVVTEPLVVGHEVVGRVIADGRAESNPDEALPPGTPVTIHPATPGTKLAHIEDRPNIWPESRYLGSAATNPHTQGAMSDLFTARAEQIRVLPAELPLLRGVLAEPLGVGLHAIRRAGGAHGKRVLISGAVPIGLLAATPTFDAVITHVFAPEDAVAAFERASDSRASSKVVLPFDPTEPLETPGASS